MDKIALPNEGTKFLLVCVDVLSRFVRAEPMKSLSSQQTKEALARMINKAPKSPDKVWTDQRKEFEGEFKKFCTVMSIEKYHTDSGTKASLAERAIRSIKALIVRYLEEKWLWRYIDKLPALVATINCRVNRSTGLAPDSVDKSHVLYLQVNKIEERTPKFNEGDTVRIASVNTPFSKGYRQQFTTETFNVYKIVSMKPPSYLLADEERKALRGKFYEPEMILVTNK